MAQSDTAAKKPPVRFEGLRAFYLLWFGQFISLFASRMTGFAITLWAWDLTGSATALVLVGVANFVPTAILSPIAGALVDRWSRKLIIMLSDFASALATAILLVLFITNTIQIWHLYALAVFNGVFGSFQYPAYAAVITTMVPKEFYARANSMRSIIQSASGIAAPLLAGVLIAPIGINGIMVIDLVTFAIAIGIIVFITIPQPKRSKEGEEGQGTLWQETLFGFRYLFARPSLTAFFLLFTAANIATAFGYPMMNPMILLKTSSDAAILGAVNSMGSVGFLAGGLLMSAWGGPKKKIHGVNASFILWGLLGCFIFGVGWTLPVWLAGSFFMAVFNPIINANFMSILQAKVAPDIQGRIFGVDMMVTTISFPIGQVVAGQLVDKVFEPALTAASPLSDLLGGLVGTAPGAGTGLMILIGGVVSIATGLLGYAVYRIREIEAILPDHEAVE